MVSKSTQDKLVFIGVLGLGFLLFQNFSGNLNQIGGDAGYNRAEIVSPTKIISSIPPTDYYFPSAPRSSIVK